jgi:tetratricopeptide (TPR) repeat protein
MSYISEALKKAQEEKDGSCLHYSNIFKDGLRHEQPRKKGWIIGSVAMAAIAIIVSFVAVWNVKVMGKRIARESAPILQTAAPEITYGMKESEGGANLKVKDAEDIRVKQAIDSKIQGGPEAGSKVKCINSRGNDAARLYAAALGKQKGNELAAAEVLYNQVLAIEPNHVYSLNNLGVICMVEKKSDRAVELFNRALTLKRNYVDPYYNLACLYAQRNETAKSIAHLKMAAVINPEVINWARNDTDLKTVINTDIFKIMMEEKVH